MIPWNSETNNAMNILVATEKAFAPVAVKQIREIAAAEGHEIILLENYKNVSEFLSVVSDADALIVRSDLVNSMSHCCCRET